MYYVVRTSGFMSARSRVALVRRFMTCTVEQPIPSESYGFLKGGFPLWFFRVTMSFQDNLGEGGNKSQHRKIVFINVLNIVLFKPVPVLV